MPQQQSLSLTVSSYLLISCFKQFHRGYEAVFLYPTIRIFPNPINDTSPASHLSCLTKSMWRISSCLSCLLFVDSQIIINRRFVIQCDVHSVTVLYFRVLTDTRALDGLQVEMSIFDQNLFLQN